jgi:hypothetical protein
MFAKLTRFVSVSALCLTAAVSLAADEKKAAPLKPDATIAFSGGSVAVGIGFTWGSGDVVFQGKTHKIKIDGLSVGEIGGNKVSATGKVFNLKKIEDIAGTYASAAAGGSLLGGGGNAAMKNDKGVVIELATENKGLSLKLAAEGVKIRLEK